MLSMPQYRVFATMKTNVYKDVEATSPEEAKILAMLTYESDFQEDHTSIFPPMLSIKNVIDHIDLDIISDNQDRD